MQAPFRAGGEAVADEDMPGRMRESVLGNCPSCTDIIEICVLEMVFKRDRTVSTEKYVHEI